MINNIGFQILKKLINFFYYYFRLFKNVNENDNFDNKDDTNDNNKGDNYDKCDNYDKGDNLNDFSKLPYLVIIEIFNQLPDRKELINCSFVCKTWRNIYKTAFKLNSLYLYENFVPKNTRLFYTNQKTNQFKLIKISNFDCLKLADNKFNFGQIEKFMSNILNYYNLNLTITDRKFDFSKIKKLIIFNFTYDDDLTIANLKKFSYNFKELEHLEIDGVIFKLDDKSELSLPKIKILVLKYNRIMSSVYNEYYENYLTFNCPLLEVIYLESPDLCVNSLRLNFLHPESVKYFQIIDFPENVLIDFECGFENLEFLLIDRFEKLIKRKTLKYLPSLKFISEQTIDGIESQDLLWKSSGLKIMNSYFELKDCLQIYLKYRRKLNLYPYQIDSEYYNNLIRRIPSQLLKRNYFKIQELKIKRVSNELVLIDLLKDIGHLEVLMIGHTSNLSQFFYDNLSKHLSIKEFVFSDLVYRKKDYKFLEELNVLEIRIPFIELSQSIVENLIKNKFYNHIKFKKFKNSKRLDPFRDTFTVPYLELERDKSSYSFTNHLVRENYYKKFYSIERSVEYIRERLKLND